MKRIVMTRATIVWRPCEHDLLQFEFFGLGEREPERITPAAHFS
jgi:hypothetical protein